MTNTMPLIHLVRLRQLKFLGHILRMSKEEPARRYALYILTIGKRRPGRPRSSYLNYVQRLLGDNEGAMQEQQIAAFADDRCAWRNLVVACSRSRWMMMICHSYLWWNLTRIHLRIVTPWSHAWLHLWGTTSVNNRASIHCMVPILLQPHPRWNLTRIHLRIATPWSHAWLHLWGTTPVNNRACILIGTNFVTSLPVVELDQGTSEDCNPLVPCLVASWHISGVPLLQMIWAA